VTDDELDPEQEARLLFTGMDLQIELAHQRAKRHYWLTIPIIVLAILGEVWFVGTFIENPWLAFAVGGAIGLALSQGIQRHFRRLRRAAAAEAESEFVSFAARKGMVGCPVRCGCWLPRASAEMQIHHLMEHHGWRDPEPGCIP
jgi:hypothetical protein